MNPSQLSQSDLALAIASTVLRGFDKHFRIFQRITSGARRRFEAADWGAVHKASRRRILQYDKRVGETIHELCETFAFEHLDEALWTRVKHKYVQLLQEHYQPELAESFYNSVFCSLFHRCYFNNDHIFVRSAVSTEYIESQTPAYHVYYPAKYGLRTTVHRILAQCGFTLPFEDLKRDVRHITSALCHNFR